MEIQFQDDRFHVNFKNSERDIVKSEGFIYDSFHSMYFTKDIKTVVRLREHLKSSAKSFIDKYTLRKLLPWAHGSNIPKNLKLSKVQLEAIKFASVRNHSYLALEPGLGKTPTAVTLINSIFKLKPWAKVIVVVPPFLVSNWLREMSIWLTVGKSISPIIYSKKTKLGKGQLFIVPDSLIDRDHFKLFKKEIKDLELLIVDEAHRFNNDSKRTEALYGKDNAVCSMRSLDGLTKISNKVVLLSGTPMERPIHLYPVLSSLAANIIGYRNYISYGTKYCNGHTKFIGVKSMKFGRLTSFKKKIFDVSGVSHETEFKARIKKFMLYRRLQDHTDLKGFKEIVVTLDNDKPLHIETRKLEKKLFVKNKIDKYIGRDKGVGDIAKYRKQIALDKIKVCSKYITDILENSSESIIVFGIHIEALESLKESLKKYKPEIINGSVSMKARDDIEKRFMNGEFKILIANIKTMVGLNLTKASRGIFIESDWTVSGNRQARDRMNRIGQKRFCTFEHLVLANTLDEYVLRKVVNQSESISRILK